MTPNSPLTGLLVGLLDGAVVALVVMTVLVLLGRRQRSRVLAATTGERRASGVGVEAAASEPAATQTPVAAHLREVA